MARSGGSRLRKAWLGAVLLTALLPHVWARADQNLESLKEISAKIQSIKADFIQKRSLPILTKPLLSEGKFYFSAPDSLRWEYLGPVRSVMLQKGKALKLYHYSEGRWKPELTPAVESIRMVLSEISLWFQGHFDESKSFEARFLPGPPKHIALIPKRGIDKFVQRIEIFLSEKPGLIDRVEMEEPDGSRTVMEFKKSELNTKIPPGIFENP
jgi:outer membrane lipoprotein carrier protein